MGTCNSDDEKTKCKFYEKEGHYMRKSVIFKRGLKRKVFKDFRDIDLIKKVCDSACMVGKV
jgi:hypothetical protein